MNWNDVIKALLGLGVSLLGKLIPALGGFLGGPFGFIASWAISWLSGKLYDWIEQLARFKGIDAQAIKDLNEAKAAQKKLIEIQDDKFPGATKEDHEKAIADFRDRVRTLGKFRV